MTRTLIITGASKGIGAHLADQAIEQGFQVIGISRTAGTNSSVDYLACDISNPDALEEALKPFRRSPDIVGLINAAGIASMNLTLTSTPEKIRQIIEVNLLGTIYVNRIVGKILARNKSGRIINFSTIAVPLSLKGEAAYVASKAGVEGFSRSFAREMADFNVTVNVIAPGPIDTDLVKGVPPENLQDIIDQQIIPRPGQLQDIWNQVALILEDRADMITGQIFNVGGA